MGQAFFIYCLVILNQLILNRATITLTSTLDGRQAACPGEVVTYICNVTQGFLIGWNAAPVLDAALVQFAPTDSRILGCSNFSAVQCDGFDFLATLTNIGPVQSGAADMTSTFRFTATAGLNGTVVECSSTTSPPTPSERHMFTVAGPPSPPRTPSYTVQQYGRDSVTLTVQWQPPQYDGGAPVNYTITVSPGLSPVTTSGTSVPVTVPYNVIHTVSIVATNCNGSSSAAMETLRIVNCSDPTLPVDGSIGPYQNTTEGAKIFFRCNPGFVPPTRMTATCASNGMWSPDPGDLTCIFDCGLPVAPQRGSLESYTDTTEGSEVFYSCDPGLVPEGRRRAVCTRNGWSPNPANLNCTEVNCGMPTAPENGIIVNMQSISTVGGAQIFFRCNPRYVPAGRMSATCMSPDGISVVGTWTPDPADLVCNATTIDCGIPTPPIGVTVVQPHTTTVSSVIVYQCQQSGFAPSPPSSVCGEDGRWSPGPTQVVCVMLPASCGRPITPDNGSIEAYQNTLEGTEIFFRCNPGFVPARRMRAVCGADGRWNPDPAELRCIASAIVCGALSFSSGVTVEQFSSTIVGSEILYQCHPGFLPEGRRTLLCREDGRWNPDPRDLCTDKSLSTAATVAITAVFCLLVAFTTGTLCGALITVCINRWNKKGRGSKPAPNTQEQQQAAVVYEEVDTLRSQKIELKENMAYGPAKQ